MAGTKILQVVGYQNSGKTTLIEKMIKACNQAKITVGTIKHHGHGGPPARIVSDKDTARHKLAGASVTAVEGGGNLHIEADKLSWDLEEILSIYQSFHLDVIIIEGYKRCGYPKIVLLRDQADEVLLAETTNVIAVISPFSLSSVDTIPVFHMEEMDRFIRWFMDRYVFEKDKG